MSLTRDNPALLDPARYPFTHRITTRFADLDGNAHINNVAMAAMFEDGRVRFNRSLGMLEKAGWGRPMMKAHNLEYLGQSHYPAPVDVHFGVYLVGRRSWQLACLSTQEGKVCAFAHAVLVMTDGLVAVDLSDELKAALSEAMLRRD